MQTAAGICGPLHVLLEGLVPQRGLVRMEDVGYEAFMDSPFGAYYGRRDRAK